MANKDSNTNIYLDHAATSWPKAPGVSAVMTKTLEDMGSPARGAHRLALEGGKVVEQVRTQVARLIGVGDSRQIIFTPGATYALNLAIRGLLLQKGDHVVATCFDHNAILRPLTQLQNDLGVGVTIVRNETVGMQLIDKVQDAIRPNTRLLTLNHASNVTGEILPCSDLIEIAHARNIVVLLDACQTVGYLPLRLETLPADMIAFGGHKALLGPPGVGCLVIGNPELRVVPQVTGGTGHNSSDLSPDVLYPSSLEPGTLNVPAIAGLGTALEFHQETYKNSPSMTWNLLRQDCIRKLKTIPKVRMHSQEENSVPIISFNIEGLLPEHVSSTLDVKYNIQTRAGLHCAPLAHEALGTGKYGSVRASFGSGNSSDDSKRLLEAIRELTA